MKHITFRLSVAIITLITGIIAVTIWATLSHQVSKDLGETSLPTDLPKQPFELDNQSSQETTLIYEQGLYYNYDYAYSVRIPNGMIGYRSPSPMPNHGFGVTLSKEDEAKVWMDASYNSFEWASFDDAIEANLSFLKDKDNSDIKLAHRVLTRLSGLRAVRFIVSYKRSEIQRIEDVILALRKDGGIVYTLDLSTTPSRYFEDKKVINKLCKRFRLKPLPFKER